jgi:glucoamylase
VKARVFIAPATIAALLVMVATSIGAVASAASKQTPAVAAPGAPGSESYFDLARKDCVGTARNTNSKVWFTVADGVLSDTYWPTIDATNVHTLQYIVTGVSGGKSFTDLQTRDMTYSVVPDPTGMSCTVVASPSPSNAAHRYSITTTYIADPARDSVLMRTTFKGRSGDHLYVRLDPLAGGTGGGGAQNAGANSALIDQSNNNIPIAYNTNTTTDAVNRDYAVPTYMALESSGGFSSESVGYADSASDGLNMLDATGSLTPYTTAADGHVTVTAGVALPPDGTVNLALGFGTDQATAESVAGRSVRQSFDGAWSQYERQWVRYDAGLRRPSPRLGAAAVREYYESVNVVKASEDKTFPGAIAAGLASPWGQAVPAGELTNGEPTYFGSYREEFSRDTYEAFAGLLVAGDVQTARAATLFLFDRQQQPDGSMPRNSLPNGKAAPDTGGLQLDETADPILMAWQSGLARYPGLYAGHVVPAADFLLAHGPSDGNERWEEQSGYSPSTIAAEIAGLTAAAAIARVNHDPAHARAYQATADYFARNIKNWTVTTDGPYAPSYFIRLSKTGDPNAQISYSLNNGNNTQEPQQNIIDAGFLELVRLGVLPASDPDVQASLKVVDDVIERQTPSGPGFYRYGYDPTQSTDGYGDCYVLPSGTNATGCTPSGKPWPSDNPGTTTNNVGTGHLWPVLSGERGEYEVAAGSAGDLRFAGQLLTSMRNMTSGQGLEPEQAWEDPALAASPYGTDPTVASIGFTDGKAAGSASPLTWAQSQYARLALAVSKGRNLETPAIVTDRYVKHGPPGSLPVTVTSPANNTRISGSSVTVTGTTTPEARVDAEAVGGAGGAAAIASTRADSSGNWTLTLPAGFGGTTITVTATLHRSTGYSQVAVTNVSLPGTTVLDASDPTGDDNGPGTYAYPTDSVFVPGAFDLTHFQVSEDGTNVYIQTTIADLVNTFGSNFGAQLLDIYVKNPAVTQTSTSAAYPSMNYGIAPADAWTERLEAQGFSPVIWNDASGAPITSSVAPQFVVDDPSGTATLILPESTFGKVGLGWVFTVALTGQGSGNPPFRSFTSTPMDFNFGVCAPGGTSPICSLNPNSVPTVMDTIPPSGVSQDDELNPIPGPAELQGLGATQTGP